MNEQQNDHDLLIQIGTKLDRAILDIKELKDNTTARVTVLEDEKVNRVDYDARINDHEKRLRRLERWGAIGIGALGIIQFLLNIYSNLHK